MAGLVLEQPAYVGGQLSYGSGVVEDLQHGAQHCHSGLAGPCLKERRGVGCARLQLAHPRVPLQQRLLATPPDVTHWRAQAQFLADRGCEQPYSVGLAVGEEGAQRVVDQNELLASGVERARAHPLHARKRRSVAGGAAAWTRPPRREGSCCEPGALWRQS